MNNYLVDANIVIYVAEQRQNILSNLEGLNASKFFVSVISRAEFLLSYKGFAKDAKLYMDDCDCLPLDKEMADLAAALIRKGSGLKFQDACIAATALLKKLPLISSDKAFKKLPGLEVILLTP